MHWKTIFNPSLTHALVYSENYSVSLLILLIMYKYGEWCDTNNSIEERACELALYIIENKATVRSAAQHFSISKSTVHKDISSRLKYINKALYNQVKEVLDFNKAERHIRGGMATRKKYKGY